MRLFAGIAGLAMTSVVALTAANAADMYRPSDGVSLKDAPYVPATWTGFYVGVNGGYGWGASDDKFAAADFGYGPFAGIGSSGAFGGGQIGYNWQGNSPLVLGVEADIQSTNIKGGGHIGPDLLLSTQLDWFGTARGRLGYAAGSTLLYFTGGYAFGGLQNKFDDSGVFQTKFDGAVSGYTLGGGVEHKFTPSWSIKAEYQYLNFGKNELPSSSPCYDPIHCKSTDDAFHTVRVGLNYHVQPAYEPLK